MTPKRPADWTLVAARLAELLPRASLHPSVVAWAESRAAGEAWSVALSGGADSVALLLLVWAHWPSRRKRLVAFHFNHRLRGRESAGDARFCAALCRSLGVSLAAGSLEPGRRLAGEAGAREARFAFIDSAMGRRRRRVLWLGHQQDDVAETLLMRVARGSGAPGLAAPRPVHGFPSARGAGEGRVHLRPLLALKKAEIARALRGAGGAWREDSSNAHRAHFRNRLRRDVIPRWVRASGRDALSGAALTRELLEEDDRALESMVDDLAPLSGDGALAVGRLSGRPRAVVRRALHRWLLAQPGAGTLSRQGFELLLGAVERGDPARHSLGSHGFARIRSGYLRFEPIVQSRTPH